MSTKTGKTSPKTAKIIPEVHNWTLLIQIYIPFIVMFHVKHLRNTEKHVLNSLSTYI